MSAVGDAWVFRTGASRLAAVEQRAGEDPSFCVVLVLVGMMRRFPELAEKIFVAAFCKELIVIK